MALEWWSISEEDVLRGLRERGVEVHGPEDLTAQERALIRQYAEWAFDEAARELLDILAERLRRDRGVD